MVEGEGEEEGKGGLGLKVNLVLEGNAYDKFYNSLKTKATRNLYPVALRKFMAFLKVKHVSDLLPSLPTQTPEVNAKVIDWITGLLAYEKRRTNSTPVGDDISGRCSRVLQEKPCHIRLG